MVMSGGCLCGAVRYEIDGEHGLVGKCYCTDCQKETGTGHVSAFAVPDSMIRFTGEMRLFAKQSDSGRTIVRSFCPICGSTLRSQPEFMPGINMVRAGTLDDSSSLGVRSAIFCGSARSWDQPPAGVPAFPGLPGS